MVLVGQRLEIRAKMREQPATKPEHARSRRRVLHGRTVRLANLAKVVHQRWRGAVHEDQASDTGAQQGPPAAVFTLRDLLWVVGRVVEAPDFHHRQQLVARWILLHQNKSIEQEIVVVHAVALDGSRPFIVARRVIHFTLWRERPIQGECGLNHRAFGVHHGERLGVCHGEIVIPMAATIVVFHPLAVVVGKGAFDQFQGHHDKGGLVGVLVAVVAVLQRPVLVSRHVIVEVRKHVGFLHAWNIGYREAAGKQSNSDEHGGDGKDIAQPVLEGRLGKGEHTLVNALHLGGVHEPTTACRALIQPPTAASGTTTSRKNRENERDSMPGAGFSLKRLDSRAVLILQLLDNAGGRIRTCEAICRGA